MKKYRVDYYKIGASISSMAQISKTRKIDGVRIVFFNDGRKIWQYKCKKDFKNGIYRSWRWDSPKNILFKNWKKGFEQGIKIIFKK